nr:reverse transcriptase domain-containing protein [Tanacetum cinerariifolium]
MSLEWLIEKENRLWVTFIKPWIKWHSTDECMLLKKQIEEMFKPGKQSYLIKELKQNNGNEHPKAANIGETSGKKKPLAILMVQPWKRVARKKITQSFSPNPEILFPSLGEDEGIEEPMIIEAEIRGHCIHCMANTTTGKDRRRRTLHFGSDELRGCMVTFSIQRNHWKTRSQKVTGSAINGSRNVEAPSKSRGNYPKKEQDRSAGMYVGLRTRRDSPDSQTNSGRKIQGGNKPKISRANNNDRFHSHRRGPQQVVSAGETYPQINRNLKVYVDDLVIKSRTKDEIVRDLEETFKTLRKINMKLNPKKYTFEEELIVCLAVAKKTISAVLMTETEAKQMPIYFVSRALRGGELNYTPMEKLVLALVHTNFIVERLEEDSSDSLIEVEEELPEPWILFMDGSSCMDGSEAGLILINPKGVEFTYALRFRFDATKNEAEYEALIAELRIEKQMGEVNRIRYLEKVRTLTNSFKAFSIRQIPKSENKKADALSKIAFTSFTYLSKQVLVDELKEKSISEVEILAVVEEEGDTWMTPIFKYLEREPCQQMRRKQGNLGEGIKARLDTRSKNRMEELPHILWAHQTMIKSSNGDTPFSLTYETEAVIPVEIRMPTLRTAEVDLVQNNEALEINLDLLEEKRE